VRVGVLLASDTLRGSSILCFFSYSLHRDFVLPHPTEQCGITHGPFIFGVEFLNFENLSPKWKWKDAGGGCNVAVPNPPQNVLAEGPRANTRHLSQPPVGALLLPLLPALAAVAT